MCWNYDCLYSLALHNMLLWSHAPRGDKREMLSESKPLFLFFFPLMHATFGFQSNTKKLTNILPLCNFVISPILSNKNWMTMSCFIVPFRLIELHKPHQRCFTDLERSFLSLTLYAILVSHVSCVGILVSSAPETTIRSGVNSNQWVCNFIQNVEVSLVHLKWVCIPTDFCIQS